MTPRWYDAAIKWSGELSSLDANTDNKINCSLSLSTYDVYACLLSGRSSARCSAMNAIRNTAVNTRKTVQTRHDMCATMKMMSSISQLTFFFYFIII